MEVSGWDGEGYVTKDIMVSALLSYRSMFSGGSQQPHHKNTQVAVRKSPRGKELKPPAMASTILPTMGVKNEPHQKQIFLPKSSSHVTVVPADAFTATLTISPLTFLIHRNCEIINVLFTPKSFGIGTVTKH